MSRPVRALAVLLLLLLSAGAAGCGSGETNKKNDYINAVQLATDNYKNRFTQIERQLAETSTSAQDRATLGQFTKATSTVIGQLQNIKPPSDVKTLHGQLIAAYKSYLVAIDSARSALKANDVTEQKKARTELSSAIEPISTKLMEVISDINDQLRK